MKKILVIVCLIAGMAAISGCKDPMEEITSMDFKRILSPTDVSATIYNRTGVILSWKAVSNAQSYTIEIYDNADFSGTPVRKIENVTFKQVPYTITGLEGQTKYYGRIKAIGTDIEESKWVTGNFTTEVEQILEEVDIDKLTFTSVTLNWPAGQVATSINLSPGDVIHTVTSEEIAAGEATVTGLTRGTQYTATLMNGTKIRGSRSFSTLGGAVIVGPSDNLVTLIANAGDDAIFDLKAGDYTVNADIIVSKTITLRAASASQKPVIKGAVIKVKGNAGLTLKGLILDGTGAPDNNQTVIYNEGSTSAYGSLQIQDSEVKNYVKGFIYNPTGADVLISSVNISGNIIHDIQGNGGDVIDFRNGISQSFLFENNTVYNCAIRDFFRMDGLPAASNFKSVSSVITVRANTFNKVLDAGRLLYIRLASHQIHFTKNLIANSNGYYSNQSTTTITTMENNNYFNAPNFTESKASGARNDTGTFTKLDPQFTNADQGNFTIGNIALKVAAVGDPRWRQ